jgi:hypothetical protein
MSIFCPLEDGLVFLFLGTVEPTFALLYKLVPAFADSPWLGLGFLFPICCGLGIDCHSRHNLGILQCWFLVCCMTKRNGCWLIILHGYDAVLNTSLGLFLVLAASATLFLGAGSMALHSTTTAPMPKPSFFFFFSLQRALTSSCCFFESEQ